jgi:L-amino acid N-acyltransferase YncA
MTLKGMIKISNVYQMRKATTDDIDGIRRITKQIVEYRNKLFKERFRFGLKKRTSPNSKKHHFFVCTSDNEVVGITLAELIPNNNTDAYLNTLFVDKGYQKKGVGKVMFDFIMDYLKNLGIKTVIINIHKNSPMEISFFEKFGFELDYQLKPFAGMIKKLE